MKIIAHLTYLVFLIGTLSCEMNAGNGDILVTVKSMGEVIPNATVYLEMGQDSSTIYPPTNCERIEKTDSYGEAYFDNLVPGSYTLVATGFCIKLNKAVYGKEFVKIILQYRQNFYDLTIDLS